MNNLQNMNILPTSSRAETTRGLKSGNSSGKDLFQSILSNLNKAGNNSLLGDSLYSDINPGNILKTGGKFISKDLMAKGMELSGKASSVINKFKKANNSQDLTLPGSLQNQLVAFLQEQGYSLKDINQFISSSKNENGLIKIDKLLAGLPEDELSGHSIGMALVESFKDNFSSFLSKQGVDPDKFNGFFSNRHAGGENNSFIKADQIPKAQETLFKMGFGVGEVKTIIEKSLNGNGELEINKLSAELNKSFPGSISESDLRSLFSENNVKISSGMFNNAESKTDINNLLTDSDNPLKFEVQKELKETIGLLLKDKGVPEENINSFMKNLDTDLIKIGLEHKPALKDSDSWNNKIFKILEGEKQIISGLLGKDSAQGQTGILESMKQNIASSLKNKGISNKNVNSLLNSFDIDIKNLGQKQSEISLNSNLLNEKTFALLKNENLISSGEQGSLKLNLTELLKLAENKANTNQQANAAKGSIFSDGASKNISKGEDKSSFIIKETPEALISNISPDKDIKNIIRVNQANRAMNLPQPLPKIVDKMMFMIRTGEQKSIIHITPPELGKLNIDLTVKNGHLSANLNTENAMVKEIIEANVNQLKQQLSNQGLTVDKFEVMVGFDNRDSKNSNTWAGEKNRKGSGQGDQSKSGNSNKIHAAPVKTGLRNSNQIDVHV